MRLYLARHGEAKRSDEDPERGLTDAGEDGVEKVSVAVSEATTGARPERILHSGKKRARQTAEILARGLGCGDVAETRGLAPNDDPGAWLGLPAGEGDLMLVGHLPFMDRLASLLVCDDADRGAFAFVPAAVLCLESGESSSRWRVEWMVNPVIAG